MFVKIPYASLLFYILFLSGTILCIYCTIRITNICSLFTHDMLKHNYDWFRELKIFVISFYVYIAILMTYNLVIGFRSTGIVEMKKRHKVYCVDSSLVHKILYFVNHITMIAVFAISVIVSIIAFSVWTLTRLCTDGSNVPKTMPVEGYKVGYNPGEIGQYLDLKEFAPLIHLRNNETIFLYFENDRLKIFCDDYVSMLYLYNLIYFAASMVVIYAFFNMILTYSFNISRNFTKTKCEELFYLSNASEMRTLNSN